MLPGTEAGEALFLSFNFKSQFWLPKRCSQTRILPSFLQGVLFNEERMWHRSLHKVYISKGKYSIGSLLQSHEDFLWKRQSLLGPRTLGKSLSCCSPCGLFGVINSPEAPASEPNKPLQLLLLFPLGWGGISLTWWHVSQEWANLTDFTALCRLATRPHEGKRQWLTTAPISSAHQLHKKLALLAHRENHVIPPLFALCEGCWGHSSILPALGPTQRGVPPSMSF